MLLIHEPRTTTDDLLSKALDGSGIVSFCEPVFIAYQRSRPAANLALHSDQSTVLMWWSSGDSDVLAAGNVFALSIDLQQRCIVPLRETSTASYIYDMWFSRCTNDLIYTIEGQSSNIDDFSIKLVFYNATFSPSPRVSPAPLLEYVDAFPLALSAPLVAHAMNSSETVFALATLNKELHVFDLQRQVFLTVFSLAHLLATLKLGFAAAIVHQRAPDGGEHAVVGRYRQRAHCWLKNRRAAAV
eukprot:m.511843 g.511843  ORF g.511843 m.511843 type:complete len:243 (-) comp57432_c0_seq17:946-1674(-)